jgi:hypothetical protein
VNYENGKELWRKLMTETDDFPRIVAFDALVDTVDHRLESNICIVQTQAQQPDPTLFGIRMPWKSIPALTTTKIAPNIIVAFDYGRAFGCPENLMTLDVQGKQLKGEVFVDDSDTDYIDPLLQKSEELCDNYLKNRSEIKRELEHKLPENIAHQLIAFLDNRANILPSLIREKLFEIQQKTNG